MRQRNFAVARFVSVPVLLLSFYMASGTLPVQAQTTAVSPDIQQIRDYKLTAREVDQWAAATRAMVAWVKSHPEDKRSELNSLGGAKSLDDMDRRARSSAPGLVKAVESSGMSFHDWWLAMAAMMSAYSVVEADHAGAAPPRNVSPENVAFVKANRDKVLAAISELNAASAHARPSRQTSSKP